MKKSTFVSILTLAAMLSVLTACRDASSDGGDRTAEATTTQSVKATESDVSGASNTHAPTTVAPTTVAPTTVAPTTVAPTTVAPTTVAPTTVTLTTTTPTTATPTTAPQVTDTPELPETPEEALGQWDPYVFDLLAEGYQDSAEKLVDAILSYEGMVTLPHGDAKVVCDNIAFEFPPAALVDLSVQGDSVTITYLHDEQTHKQKLADFERIVEEILKGTLGEGATERERALLLYQYVVNNVRYFTVDYTEKEITAYSALTKGVTICYGYADAFGYLLRQTGMEAHMYRGARSDGAEHGWCYAKVDGQWYHFDPTWETSNQKNSGVSGLYYFGMDDTRRYRTLLKQSDCGFGELEHAGETTASPEWMLPQAFYPYNDWKYDRATGEIIARQGTVKLSGN